jgi:hypothetical protein
MDAFITIEVHLIALHHQEADPLVAHFPPECLGQPIHRISRLIVMLWQKRGVYLLQHPRAAASS